MRDFRRHVTSLRQVPARCGVTSMIEKGTGNEKGLGIYWRRRSLPLPRRQMRWSSGAADSGGSFPFGTCLGGTQYQQVYSSSLFGAGLNITDISFYQTQYPGGTPNSTTAHHVPVDGPDGEFASRHLTRARLSIPQRVVYAGV